MDRLLSGEEKNRLLMEDYKICATKYDQVLAMWNLQDSLLQSYRNSFFIIQSIFFSATSYIIYENYNKPFSYLVDGTSLVFIILGAFMVIMWKNICDNKKYDVLYFQQELQKIEGAGITIYTDFKKWKKLKDHEKAKYLNITPPNILLEKLEKFVRKNIKIIMNWFFYIFFGMWIILFVLLFHKPMNQILEVILK